MLLTSVKRGSAVRPCGNCLSGTPLSHRRTFPESSRPTWLLDVVLLHALQALQQIVHFAFDLAQLPLDGLQLVHFHCSQSVHSRWVCERVRETNRQLCNSPLLEQQQGCHCFMFLTELWSVGPLDKLGVAFFELEQNWNKLLCLSEGRVLFSTAALLSYTLVLDEEVLWLLLDEEEKLLLVRRLLPPLRLIRGRLDGITARDKGGGGAGTRDGYEYILAWKQKQTSVLTMSHFRSGGYRKLNLYKTAVATTKLTYKSFLKD